MAKHLSNGQNPILGRYGYRIHPVGATALCTKKLDCWGVWLIVNTTNIVLYIKAGLAFLPFVCAGYIVLAFMGFFMWRKEYLNGLVRK